jgi:DNA-binding PadR family transcriptional regulator
MTLPMQLVLLALLQETAQMRYQRQICMLAGLPSSTVQPILERLVDLGWAESRRESNDPREPGAKGPQRRYYRLTGDGVERARIALAGARARGSPVRPDGGTG